MGGVVNPGTQTAAPAPAPPPPAADTAGDTPQALLKRRRLSEGRALSSTTGATDGLSASKALLGN
jgi:hypothetical protein